MRTGKGNHNNEQLFYKCRTCLGHPDYSHSLTQMAFMEDSRNISYGELLTEITKININDDNIKITPQYICDCCSLKLKSCHAFISQAREVNKQLLSLSQQFQIESIQKANCLEESEIDIQTCLKIKLENEGNSKDNCTPISPNSETKLEAEIDGEFSLEEKNETTQRAYDIDDTIASYHTANDDNNSSEEVAMKTLESKPDCSNRPTKVQENIDNEMDQEEEYTDADIAVPCTQCNKIFNNSKDLLRHLRNTHLPEDQKCACPICGVKFTRSCNMYKHMRKLHDPEAVKELLPAKEKPFECDKCNRRYTQKRQLNCHIKDKHSKVYDEKSDKELTKSANKKKQSEIRPLCFVCGSSFSNKAHLIVHMTRHTGEKPFSCDLCDRSFPRISDLTIHRRIHTGEKPFKCKLCDKAFRVSNKLANHMRSHTNERPYKCKQCERSFKYSKDLNIHMRVHTGERPYCCTVCGSTFTQSNSLKAHRMKLGHNDDDDNAPQPPLMQLVV